jgi:hypothetical protein
MMVRTAAGHNRISSGGCGERSYTVKFRLAFCWWLVVANIAKPEWLPIVNLSGGILRGLCLLFCRRQHPWIIVRTYAKLYVFSAGESLKDGGLSRRAKKVSWRSGGGSIREPQQGQASIVVQSDHAQR